jgi:hypothetical protein
MAGPDDRLVVAGAWCEIRYASRPDRSRPAEEFYETVSVPDQARLVALFHRLAETGKIFDRTKFKQVEGDIFGFKTKSGVRISCYQQNRVWYLLHGFNKRGGNWPKGEVIRATNLLIEHRGY